MSVEAAQVYFLDGTLGKSGRTDGYGHYEVKDPPCLGWTTVLVLPGEKRSTVFHYPTFRSFQVSNRAAELVGHKPYELRVDVMAEILTRKWTEYHNRGAQVDYPVAAMILTDLGVSVPRLAPRPQSEGLLPREEKRGGKAILSDALRPVRKESKRGRVAEFFLSEEPQSLLEAMARLGLTRSGVLSHLFCLNRDHGLGYELIGDCARLLVPESFDPFAVSVVQEPERAQTAEPSASERSDRPSSLRKPGGKPVNVDGLKPIPREGRRADVARHFYDPDSLWASMDEACAKLELSRSAVLSHLFTINKDNGLGYEVSEDGRNARLIVPDGHEVFGDRPERKRAPRGA